MKAEDEIPPIVVDPAAPAVQIASPQAIAGSQRSRCASLPNSTSGSEPSTNDS